MRFFKKLFGLVSNSEQKNDYARATFIYATSPWIKNSNNKVYDNPGFGYSTNDAYYQAVSNYSRAFEVNRKKATSVIDVGVLDSNGQRVSMSFYRSFTSTTYRLWTK